MSTQYYFPPYNASINWKQFDVIYDGIYRYATQDMAAGGAVSAPTLNVVYNVTQTKREDDKVTVYFTQTGNVPSFTQGSIVKVNGLTDPSMNYTGMALGGASGYVSYTNPGWSAGIGASAGVINTVNPGWSTGFISAPTYTSKIGTENQAIITQLGSNYSQRMSLGLNTFNQNIQLVFQNRSSREARAITTFVQDKMGKDSFEILWPDTILNNQPNQKWIAGVVDVTPVAFGLNDISVNVARVFEP